MLSFLRMGIPKRAQNNQHRETLWFLQVFAFYVSFLALFFSLFQLSFNLPFSDLCAAYALGLQGTQSWWTVLCLIRILSLHNNISIAPLMQPVLVPLGSNSLLAALLTFPAFEAHLYCCFCFGNMTSLNFILTMSNYQIKLQHCSRQENERLDSDIFMIYILPVFQF